MTEAGMLTNKELTTAQIATCRAMLKQYIAQHNISITFVAKAVGKSTSTISQFLAAKYRGDQASLGFAVHNWMHQDLKRRRAPSFDGFVLTKVAKRIYVAINFATETSRIAIIHGPAGIGKTMTVNAYRARNTNCLFVRVTAGSQNASGLLQKLGYQLSITTPHWIRTLMSLICGKLDETNRLIIVDEAHRLAYDALEALRDIHDQTGCPIALIGTAKIAHKIDDGLRDAKQWITDQFSSRICIRCNLMRDVESDGGGKLLFSVAEINKIFDAQRLRLRPEASRWLAKLASTSGFGGLRIVRGILTMAQRAKKDEITLQLVMDAYAMISDRPAPVIKNTDQQAAEPLQAAG